MKTFSLDFKPSYWPEPRLGETRETRAACIARLRGKAKTSRPRFTVQDALAALTALSERR